MVLTVHTINTKFKGSGISIQIKSVKYMYLEVIKDNWGNK